MSDRLPGRPRRCPDDVLAEVVRRRLAGERLTDICRALNDRGVPTPGGGTRWWPSHVHRLLRTRDALRLLDAGADRRERVGGRA